MWIGYDSKGECVNYSPLHNMSWGDIIEHSYKVISFLDLAGHEKYLRTTVTGMTGHMPDYCFLLVGSNMGVTRYVVTKNKHDPKFYDEFYGQKLML